MSVVSDFDGKGMYVSREDLELTASILQAAHQGALVFSTVQGAGPHREFFPAR